MQSTLCVLSTTSYAIKDTRHNTTMAKTALKCPLVFGVLVVLSLTSEVMSRAVQQAGDYESTEQSEDQQVVDELRSFLPVHDPSSSTATQSPANSDLCAAIFCGNGRKCILENGRPTCGCALECPDHYHPICGSDGVTYGNPCELHRSACLQNIKINKHLRGPCPAPPPTPEPEMEDEKPLVCYEIERDQLRQLLIDWMKGRVHSDATSFPERSYAHVLTENFRDCDLDGDDHLSGSEFIQCVEKNETVTAFGGPTPEQGHVLRGLCVDALILMSDTNEDWMLDLEEFLRCMDPNFEPPRKQCSLENKLFEDGAETRVDCNICVCACGNWVCSAMSCEDADDYNLFEPYDVEQGPLPSKEERYALLRGFIASEHINLDQVEEEVPGPDFYQGHNFGDDLLSDLEDEGETQHAIPAASPAEFPDTVPESLPSGPLVPAFDPSADTWQDNAGDRHNQGYQHRRPEPKQSVVGELARNGRHGADNEPSLQESLVISEATTTSTTTTTTTTQPPVRPATQDEGESEERGQEQIDTHPALVVEHVERPARRGGAVTPQPRPAATPAPARRFIPVVNFNITVAEHRIIHTGDSQSAETIQEPEQGRRHGTHNAPQHHNRRDHHNPHGNHHNSHGNHHSTHGNHHSSHDNHHSSQDSQRSRDRQRQRQRSQLEHSVAA